MLLSCRSVHNGVVMSSRQDFLRQFSHCIPSTQCFLVNAGLMVINLVLFLWVASKFEYKALEKPRVQPPKSQGRGVVPRWVRPQIVTGVPVSLPLHT